MKFSKFILLLIVSMSLSSCGALISIIAMMDETSVEPFGNVSFYDNGLIGCVDWLKKDDTMYYYVEVYEGNVAYGDALGAFNGEEHGYTLYPLQGDEYNGITVLEEKSIFGDVKWLYVCEEAESVPASLIYDFPHVDSWLSGGQNFKIADVTYSTYGSTKKKESITLGEEVGSYDGVTYYEVVGYSGWVCSTNKTDSNYLDLSYDITVSELPTAFVMLTKSLD